MTEYQILNLLQQMTMASNAYKTQSGTLVKIVGELLIVGFLGQLKGWWDFHFTKKQQLDILNAILTRESGESIPDQHREPIQDTVSILIFIVSLHFTGDSSYISNKSTDILSNLPCEKMNNFQSYKMTFLNRVMLGKTQTSLFGKEKFLTGLPTLLGENG